MKKICIKGTGSFLPERIVPNSYFEEIVDTSDEWIFSRTGIQDRRMVLPKQALSDIATPASEKALEMAGLSPSDLDLIIVGTSTADMPSPSAGCIIQNRLGASRAVAFDVNAACPGFIYGLAVAQKFMQDGSYQHVLVVGSEIVSHRIDFQDRATCVLFGDGAGACVVAPVEEGGILSTYLGSDGSSWDLLQLPGGGSRHPATHQTIDQKLHFLKMRGNELFKLA
ncbi:MAG: 3-oxoacyl-ACP synthase, partial [Desulfobacca sp.]|nr:3-oxoacyl-ACP synthase [Desulfobacca sp.]